MAEEKREAVNTSAEKETDYQAPAIEDVVSREKLEREVAYAGVPGPSTIIN